MQYTQNATLSEVLLGLDWATTAFTGERMAAALTGAPLSRPSFLKKLSTDLLQRSKVKGRQ